MTLLVSELRTLCECIGAAESMDRSDMEQAHTYPDPDPHPNPWAQAYP